MTETELEYQFCFNCNDRKQCYTKPKDCTRIQEEIGLQEMTNEEWLCSISTEEKAKWIAEEKMCRGYFIFPSMEEAIQDALDWLKQPHTKEDDE